MNEEEKYILSVVDQETGKKLKYKTEDKHVQLHAIVHDGCGIKVIVGSRVNYSSRELIPTTYDLNGVCLVEGSNDITVWDEWAEVKRAHFHGATIEAKFPYDDEWEVLENPEFSSEDLIYRVKLVPMYTEVTIEELEAQLGYKIKVVGDK